jgi:hypothetical protein
MPNVQVIPPAPGFGNNPATVNGRTYSAAQGTVLLVPDFDAQYLVGNGWIPCAGRNGLAGSTAQRPTNPFKNQQFFDMTVGGMVIWNGASWVHHATGAGV